MRIFVPQKICFVMRPIQIRWIRMEARAWKIRHVAMMSWWPFNLSSKGIHKDGAAQSLDAIRILVVYRERHGESSLEEIPVVHA